MLPIRDLFSPLIGQSSKEETHVAVPTTWLKGVTSQGYTLLSLDVFGRQSCSRFSYKVTLHIL